MRSQSLTYPAHLSSLRCAHVGHAGHAGVTGHRRPVSDCWDRACITPHNHTQRSKLRRIRNGAQKVDLPIAGDVESDSVHEAVPGQINARLTTLHLLL